MENSCKMDCHSCKLQDGIENKSMCATLLLPSMIKNLTQKISELKQPEQQQKQLKPVSLDGKSSELPNLEDND